jgi:signal transduction histidine kinase
LNLRRRVTFALVAIVTLFISVQGVLAYLTLEEQEDDLVDELVYAEARRLAARAERGELQGPEAAELFQPSPNLSAWLVDASGHAAPGPLPPHLRTLAEGPHRPRHREQELHVVVITTAAGRLYVQYDAEQNEAKVREFGIYLLGLGALCVLLGAIIARRVATIVVAPIERLTGLLSDWVPEASMKDYAVSDEESRLLDAFRRVQGRFEEAIAHEREFIANVGHEIRTPLAALRTDLELLALSVAPKSSQHERVRRAVAAVDTITESLESARALSRRQQLELQPVNLAQCVDDAWASLGAYPQAQGLRFANIVPAATVVNADRHALLTILRNLIRNVAEHAAAALCTVRLTKHGVEVIDDGPGIAGDDLAFIFDRYYRGRLADSPGQESSDDHGLGLAIARQVADLNGWTLTATSEPGRGTCFTLALR